MKHRHLLTIWHQVQFSYRAALKGQLDAAVVRPIRATYLWREERKQAEHAVQYTAYIQTERNKKTATFFFGPKRLL